MAPDGNKTRELVAVAMCVAAICVSAFVSIPIPFATAMVTALTITMNLTALLLTPRQTLTAVALYVLLGAVGLPVYVGGAAGLGELFSPRGGFLVGFMVAFPLVSRCKGEPPSMLRYCAATIGLGVPIIYAGGMLSAMHGLGLTPAQAFLVAALPFIPLDVLKCVLASWLALRIKRANRR